MKRGAARETSSKSGSLQPPLRGIPRVKRVWMLAVVATLLAGCGVTKHRAVTVGAYGNFPAQTITGVATPAECARDGRAFARGAILLLAHSGPNASYPADLYYSILREEFADFEARGCDPKALGDALRARLTAKQRAALVADLPAEMAKVVRAGLS